MKRRYIIIEVMHTHMGVILLRIIKQSHRSRDFGYKLADDGFVLSNTRDFVASNGFILRSDDGGPPGTDIFGRRYYVRNNSSEFDNTVLLIQNNRDGQDFLRGLRLAVREYNQGTCKKSKINKFSYKSRLYL